MAYNNRNYYMRIVEIQEITLREQKRDSDKFLKEIYHELIYPRYHISYRTYSKYLGINAKRELKKLKENDR